MKQVLLLNKICIIFLLILSGITAYGQMNTLLIDCDKRYPLHAGLFCSCDSFYNFFTEEYEHYPIIDHSAPNWETIGHKRIKIVLTFIDSDFNGSVNYLINDTESVITGTIKKGKFDGLFLYHFRHDSMSVRFVEDKKEGAQRISLNSGEVQKVCEYEGGKKNGSCSTYIGNVLRYNSYYSHGYKEGGEFNYNHFGGLSYFLVYKRGKVVDGKYYHFNEIGLVDGFMIFRNHKLVRTKHNPIQIDYRISPNQL